MDTTLLRAGALCCALLATTCLTAAAAAQTCCEEGGTESTISPPAERLLVTASGVDMRSGRYGYSATDLSIGDDNETGGLALTRNMAADLAGHDNPFANFSHNWDIMVTEKSINIAEGNYDCCGPDLRVGVHYGGRSETFDGPHGQAAFEQASRNRYARLTVSGSGGAAAYTFQANDGTVALFRPIGNSDCSTLAVCAYVAQISHADGTRFTFDYDPGPGPTRLRAVTSNRGYVLLFQYGTGADANHVTESCVINLAVQVRPADNACPANPQATASYSYAGFEGKRRLASAADANGATSTFTYAREAGLLRMGFLRPGDTVPWLVNTLTERTNQEGIVEELVDSQAFADDSSWTYTRTYAPQVEGQIPQVAGGAYRDPAGHWTTVAYGFYRMPASYAATPDAVTWQITPGPIEITDPLNRVTTTDYCDPNAAQNLPPSEHNRCLVTPVPVAHILPGGQRTELSWDLYTRNLLQVRRKAASDPGLADIVTSSGYFCTPAAMVNCGKPTTRTDANGNVTLSVYDAVHGGLLTETGPAVNGISPQTRHGYGQLYARLADGAGGWVQAATPVWVRTATSMCRTSAATGNPAAPCAAGALDEIRTLYDYGPASGPSNLLLRGQAVTAEDQGALVTHRTCYGHDSLGRRISETQPNANLPSCP